MQTVKWQGDISGYVELIDQTLLPGKFCMLTVRDVETMFQAIKNLQVRGAPAIGVAAAYGVVLGLAEVNNDATLDQARKKISQTCDYLAGSRPTAVNLFWALERMQRTALANKVATVGELKQHLLAEAEAIRTEDAAMCRAIGANGADLIKDGMAVLTHCNAGGLATAEYGTALAVMFTAGEQGKRFRVFVDETRPLLQGARLTTWELSQAGIDTTLICDNMAGHLMSISKIDLVITGADRIAANGDTANKIGTYSLAVLAHAHDIPFYIAAPSSTFDLSLTDGSQIPIEERPAEEVTTIAGEKLTPDKINVYNPAFDVTPHRYIKAIITERGKITPLNTQTIRNIIVKRKLSNT